jgi:MFS family permease
MKFAMRRVNHFAAKLGGIDRRTLVRRLSRRPRLASAICASAGCTRSPLAAAGILMVTMGARQSLGLFMAPLNAASTGLGIVTISLALAVGQFTWGAIQPVAGAVADRYGPRRC